MVTSLPPALVRRKLAADNPWWVDGSVPDATLRPRRQLDVLTELATRRDVQRAVLLLGPRRVGKTVLLRHLLHRLIREGELPTDLMFASLDTPTYGGLGLDDLVDLFREQHGHDRSRPLWVMFDEIQYLPDWERHLKVLVDKEPNLRILASGSAAAALKRKSRESGAGRFTELSVGPLSFGEFLGMRLGDGHDAPENWLGRIDALNAQLVDYVNFGGFPEAVGSATVQHEFQRYVGQDIIEKVLLRDLPSVYGIDDPLELNRFFQHLAFKTGREIAFDELGKDTGLSKNTIRKYLDYLEAAFLVRKLERVDAHAKRFKRVTHFKVYLSNPSLRAALFGPVTADDEAFEALVETAFLSLMLASVVSREAYYARWSARHRSGRTDLEVDFVQVDGLGRVTRVREVKWSDRVASHLGELAGLQEFCAQHGVPAMCLTRSTLREEGPVKLRPVAIDLLAAEREVVGRPLREGIDPVSGERLVERPPDAADPA